MKISIRKNRKQVKLHVLKFLLLIITVVLFADCKSKKQIVANTDYIAEKAIEKDKLIPVTIPGETSSLRAVFECDSLNRVLLRNFNELKSKNMNSTFSFSDGLLKYNSETAPDTVYLKSTERWYYTNRQINKTITITKKESIYINKFGVLDWLGLINLICIGVWLVYQLFTKTTILSIIKRLLKIN